MSHPGALLVAHVQARLSTNTIDLVFAHWLVFEGHVSNEKLFRLQHWMSCGTTSSSKGGLFRFKKTRPNHAQSMPTRVRLRCVMWLFDRVSLDLGHESDCMPQPDSGPACHSYAYTGVPLALVKQHNINSYPCMRVWESIVSTPRSVHISKSASHG